MATLQSLFTPMPIRDVELPNRVVSTAHSTGLSEAGAIGDRLIAYHRARARGGVGLIVVGTTSVDPTSISRHQTALVNWNESVIPTYNSLAEAVHPHGTKVFVQLNHAGGLSGAPGGIGAVVAPSPILTELGVSTPHELDRSEIDRIRQAFADAAMRVVQGGLDGIEIHAGHGNLIQQFLSPLTNARQDSYGGDRRRRRRFAEEIVASVRSAVGGSFPVGIRMAMQEDLPGGLTLDETLEALEALIRAGDLDYVSVTTGSDTSSISLPRHYAPMYLPSQHLRLLAARVKATVNIPVLVAGRITDPRDADDIIRSGDADLVGMTRALIADADLPRKVLAGDYDEIRYCVGINDGCLGRLFRGLPISCVQDPVSGRELELGAPTPAGVRRRVVVVGGGPAGLEAARVAAERGHDVTLIESHHEPGGLVRLARQTPGRGETGAIVDQLVRACERAGVDLRLATEADTPMILGLSPDAVVVATGSTPVLPPLPGGGDRLLSCADVYRRGTLIGTPLVVFDEMGDMEGLSTAEWLAEQGLDVSVVTAGWVPGWRVEPMTRQVLIERLVERGVRIRTRSSITALTDDGIRVLDLLNGVEETMLGVATVVSNHGRDAKDGLYADLRRAGPTIEVILAGDARAPRGIEAAIYEGHLAGRSI